MVGDGPEQLKTLFCKIEDTYVEQSAYYNFGKPKPNPDDDGSRHPEWYKTSDDLTDLILKLGDAVEQSLSITDRPVQIILRQLLNVVILKEKFWADHDFVSENGIPDPEQELGEV